MCLWTSLDKFTSNWYVDVSWPGFVSFYSTCHRNIDLSTVQDSPATGASKGWVNNASDKYSSLSATSNNNEDDDFDPRGTSNSSKPSTVMLLSVMISEDTNTVVYLCCSPQVDLFGDSLIGDLLDAPKPVPSQDLNRNSKSEEVDLFADVAFVSAPTSVAQRAPMTKVDLFVAPPAAAASSGT
ncbi:ENTH/VHS-like protein [Artemisia annua]|uniref:ENTH/VHS-like protein n=1 Tax=Artemisia annua TaxID=35608 RepID=A0A2U1LF73_ARTAN|nr:ENTH/VHS-like protein [Artemisia annua]